MPKRKIRPTDKRHKKKPRAVGTKTLVLEAPVTLDEPVSADVDAPVNVDEPVIIDQPVTLEDSDAETAETAGETVTAGAEEWSKKEFTQRDTTTTFTELQASGEFVLNEAVLAGLTRKKFVCPTPVQRAAIPMALSGTDCLIKAPTGTGKTLAYAVPILSIVCDAAELAREPSQSEWRNLIKAIILVPSKELVTQVADVLASLCFHVHDLVNVWGMPDAPTGGIRDFRLPAQVATVLVTQPAALVRLCKQILSSQKRSAETLTFFPNVRHLVIDEADLVLGTFGFFRETSELFKPTSADWDGRAVSIVPTGQATGGRAQIFLVSATLNEELGQLKRLALYKPSVLCVSDSDEIDKDPMLVEDDVTQLVHLKVAGDGSRAPIRHFVCRVNRSRQEDWLALFCLLEFKWCPSKHLIFTNSVEQAYRIFLFLQHFGYKVAVATPTQTLTVRLRNIQKFNQSVVTVLVGVDAVFDQGEDPIASVPSKKTGDKLSNVARGLDFKGVESIIHFDCVKDADQYTHRCGRAVRDFKRSGLVGTSVSILDYNETMFVQEDQVIQIEEEDKKVFKTFAYRVGDTCKKLTVKAIRNCQLKEATEEIEIDAVSQADKFLLKMAKKVATRDPTSTSRIPAYLLPAVPHNPLK